MLFGSDCLNKRGPASLPMAVNLPLKNSDGAGGPLVLLSPNNSLTRICNRPEGELA